MQSFIEPGHSPGKYCYPCVSVRRCGLRKFKSLDHSCTVVGEEVESGQFPESEIP